MATRKLTYADLEAQNAELQEENDTLNSRLDLVTSAANGDLDEVDEDEDEDEYEEAA